MENFSKSKLREKLNNKISARVWIFVVALMVIIICSLIIHQYLIVKNELVDYSEINLLVGQNQEEQRALSPEIESEIIDGRIVELRSDLIEVVDQKIIFYDSEKNKVNEIDNEKILRKFAKIDYD